MIEKILVSVKVYNYCEAAYRHMNIRKLEQMKDFAHFICQLVKPGVFQQIKRRFVVKADFW